MLRPVRLRALVPLALLAACGGAPTSVDPAAVAPSPPTPPPRAASDAGAPADAGSGPAPSSLPFGEKPSTWTWVDVPGTRCGNGSPSGMGVNLYPGATKVLLFLQGGGACADAAGCWTSPTASHIASGYGEADLGPDTAKTPLLFSRGDAENPFKGAHFVFVPYCTGDLHAGDNVASYAVDGVPTPTYHYGAHNVDAILARLADELSGIDRVWLTGESAGGFGAVVNQDFAARALRTRVDVIDDSGPPLNVTGSGFPATWGVRLPPACADCANGLDRVFAFDRRTYPETRFAFMTFSSDPVLPEFYGVSPATFETSFTQFLAAFTHDPNTQWFEAFGSGHVVIGSIGEGAAPSLPGWLTLMTRDDPRWTSQAQ